MKPLNFLKSLLPNFAKQTVLEDIRTTRLVLTTLTIPAYQDSLRIFGARKFSNDSLVKDWEIFRRNVKGASGPNTISAIEKSFKPMLGTLDLIERLVDKDYNDDIEGAGVTYYKAAVLQMVESIGFAAEYAAKYLNYALVVESAEIANEDGNVIGSDGDTQGLNEISASIMPIELRYIHDRFLDFCNVMDTLSKPTDKIKNDFQSIPDVAVTESGDAIMAHTAGRTLDPFNHGIVPIAMNPVFHIRMKIADYQHYRYEKAKAEKEALELRLMRMERLQQGKNDAALEKQIIYTQQRIDNLTIKIKKVEEEYA